LTKIKRGHVTVTTPSWWTICHSEG